MLNPDELLRSSVVANATMNRGRGLSGVNSYTRDLRFDIASFPVARVRERGEAVWYDACCGVGRALVEAGQEFRSAGWGDRVEIVGVDLVEMFTAESSPGVRLIAADVAAYRLGRAADLITCVHGLHYLGDKLGFLEHAHAMLTPGGLLIGHLDADNIRSAASEKPLWPQAVRRAREAGARLELKGHVLRVEQAQVPLDFQAPYVGATVSRQPNYTGITVIDSCYEPVRARV